MNARDILVRFIRGHQEQEPAGEQALDSQLGMLREAILLAYDREMNRVKNSPTWDAETTRRDLQLQINEGK